MTEAGARKGRSKGRRFEYKVRDECTEWLGERCHRNDGHEHHGDILTPIWFPFIIEAKHHLDVRLDLLAVSPDTHKLTRWWEQVEKHCRVQGKGRWPMLVFHRTYGPTLVMIQGPVWSACKFAQIDMFGKGEIDDLSEGLEWEGKPILDWRGLRQWLLPDTLHAVNRGREKQQKKERAVSRQSDKRSRRALPQRRAVRSGGR